MIETPSADVDCGNAAAASVFASMVSIDSVIRAAGVRMKIKATQNENSRATKEVRPLHGSADKLLRVVSCCG